MTMTPNSAIASVTAISTLRWAGPAPWACPASMAALRAPPVIAVSVSDGAEPGAHPQLAMALIFLFVPVGVVGTRHEGLIERAITHQLLQLGRFADLLHQIDIVGDLLLGGARRHEDAAQHQILD